MLEMIIGTGRHGFHRVSQERVFYPTLIQRTAEDIIPEEFFKLPNPVFFNIFVFPNAAANQGFCFYWPGHGPQKIAVPTSLGSFTIRGQVNDTGQGHQDM